jgi:hypothetical protein
VSLDAFRDVFVMPGDRAMVEGSVQEALGAGVTEAEIDRVLTSEPRDVYWVPLVSGRLGSLARARGPRRAVPPRMDVDADDDLT